MKDVFLNETDRRLVWIAARLLVALESGQSRMGETERLVQLYRDDLLDAYPTADPALIEDMAVNFGGALMRRMEQLLEGAEDKDPGMQHRGTPQVRTRVMEAIGGYLRIVDPRQ